VERKKKTLKCKKIKWRCMLIHLFIKCEHNKIRMEMSVKLCDLLKKTNKKEYYIILKLLQSGH
jgi:hypothetical protein